MHHVAGRLRIRIPELRRNSEAAIRLRTTVACRRGIRSVEVNVLTGSLLVYYEPALLTMAEVLAIIGRCGQLPLRPLPACAAQAAVTTKIAGALLGWAIERAVESSVLFLVRTFL